MSDSNGYVYDPNGIDLAYVKDLKEVRRGRIKEYAETHKDATYVADCTKVWTVPCDIALPDVYKRQVQHHQQSPAGQYLQHICFLFLHRISSFSSGPASEDVSFRFSFQGPITP